MDVQAHDWNQRYRGATLLWTEQPNQFLVEEASGLTPGRALDLGTGEGRNAMWLAEQGWQVTAVDFSQVALTRAAAAAEQRGVHVDWVNADLSGYVPSASTFDLISVLYLHLPPALRRQVLDRATAALRPGGRLLVVGHDLDNLVKGHGGPQEAGILYRPETIAAELSGLTIARTQTVKRHVATIEGRATAFDSLVLAIKPGTSASSFGTVTARWSGTPFQFDITGPRGHVVPVDEPAPLGLDQGMKPSEMLLGALATCSAISAVSLLQKMRQPLGSLFVRVEGRQQPDWPKAFTDIHLQFVLGGDGPFDEALVTKAIELATTRYCPVSATIGLGQGGCRIDAGFTIVRDMLAGAE
ncbi:MAG TPA: methyltransferase domain-containing protein [Candidatus Sulfotelmatobacter sp.]|nr:methyltransferase domain-containing protein [Candidatus Sulfotelmatobacter sp.]